MKIAKVLIIAAAIISVVSVVSRITVTPVANVAARPMIVFAALLLLFAIALEGLK